MACRIQKRKEWSLRILHEAEEYNDNIFITLTYDDNHIPDSESLRKTDLQKFYKRLRRDLDGQKALNILDAVSMVLLLTVLITILLFLASRFFHLIGSL